MTTEQWEHFEGAAFTGFDTDRTVLRIFAMNLMLHSISNPKVDYKDSISKQNVISDKFSMILANFKYPTHQIVFCTEKALSCLEYERSYCI